MSSPSSAPSPTWKALIDELLMIRRSAWLPGSTLTISGSASVRKLARKASYLTSFRSGPDWPIDIGAAIFMLDVEVIEPADLARLPILVSDIFDIEAVAPPAGFAMPAIEPEFFRFSKICSAGV